MIENGKVNEQKALEFELTKVLRKAVWTLSNMYAENQVSSRALSTETVESLLSMTDTLVLHFSQQNCKIVVIEVLFALCNLVTESSI